MIDTANVDKPLTKELCKQWIVALRSGAYLQGQNQLKRENRYCCLGVLNEIANLGVPHHFGILAVDRDNSNTMVALPEDTQRELWERNDGCNQQYPHDFGEIADYIEAEVLPNLSE